MRYESFLNLTLYLSYMATEIPTDVASKILKVYKLLEPYFILVEPLLSSEKQLMYAEALLHLGCRISSYFSTVYLSCDSIKFEIYPFNYEWIEKLQSRFENIAFKGKSFSVGIARWKTEELKKLRLREFIGALALREFIGTLVPTVTSFTIDDTFVEPEYIGVGEGEVVEEGVVLLGGLAVIRGTPEEYKPGFRAYVEVKDNEITSFKYSWQFYEHPPVLSINLPKPVDRPIKIFNKFWQLYGDDIVEAVIKAKPYLDELKRSLSLLILY